MWGLVVKDTSSSYSSSFCCWPGRDSPTECSRDIFPARQLAGGGGLGGGSEEETRRCEAGWASNSSASCIITLPRVPVPEGTTDRGVQARHDLDDCKSLFRVTLVRVTVVVVMP